MIFGTNQYDLSQKSICSFLLFIFRLLVNLSDVDFLAWVVFKVAASTGGRVLGVTAERLARRVKTSVLYITAQVARGGELQLFLRWQLAYLRHVALIGVLTLTLRDVDDGKGAEALDGYAEGAL